MAKQKEDPLSATHFTLNHHTAAGAKGSLVTAEQLNESFGRNDKHSDEQHAVYLKSSLKRLLDLGAITPAEAPEEAPDPEEAARAAEDRRKADEDAAKKAAAEREKHPQPKK